jgi:hypothetical protein
MAACAADVELAAELELTDYSLASFRYLTPDPSRSSSLAKDAVIEDEANSETDSTKEMAHFERVKQALEVCDFTSDDIQV